VCGDALRLRQVIINLLSNAVKFTERGEVRIKVRNTDMGLLNSSFHFEITDTGIGIKPENCAAIFDSFAQEDSSTTRKFGGTGLGLAICKQLVELMGGEIGVSSVVGQGSTFFFSVPLTADPAAVRDDAGTVLTGTRMLLVDDNPTSLRILREHLESWGVMVRQAETSGQAMKIVDQALAGEFDAMIVDGEMTIPGGTGLAASIRSRGEFAEVPLLLISSGPIEGAAWLAKPIRRAQFQARLVDLLTFESTGSSRAPRQGAAAAVQAGRVAAVRRVLLVEDNPVNQEVARAMLLELGVEASSAWGGEEALRMLAADQFEAVLMDCQMPNLDGYETTSRFREWERQHRRPRTPIIALTANALSGDAERCFAAGMDRYLSKPFSIDQLYGVLESCRPNAAAAPARQPPRAAPPAAAVPPEPSSWDGGAKKSGGVLDPETLGRIRALHRPGSPDLLAKVVGLYTSNSAVLTEAMRRAALANDAAGLLQAAHALKSSSANVGAVTLAELCKDVETAVADGAFDFACLLVERLLAEHRQVLQALGEQSIAA
jgi:CheY-like chemotaxis protein